MITQMSPLFQVMSVPVSTLAANEMAARASMNTPSTDPHVCGEGGKTRCEARVLALQALPDDGRGPRRAGYRPRAQS